MSCLRLRAKREVNLRSTHKFQRGYKRWKNLGIELWAPRIRGEVFGMKEEPNTLVYHKWRGEVVLLQRTVQLWVMMESASLKSTLRKLLGWRCIAAASPEACKVPKLGWWQMFKGPNEIGNTWKRNFIVFWGLRIWLKYYFYESVAPVVTLNRLSHPI